MIHGMEIQEWLISTSHSQHCHWYQDWDGKRNRMRVIATYTISWKVRTARW